MTFSQAQLHAAEAFILKNRKNLEDKDSTIPREVWLVAAAMQEERDEKRRLLRRVVDNYYMLQAYRKMLGPKGLEVATMWETKGVKRVHYDWTPQAYALTGEQRAETILDLEKALHTEPFAPPSSDPKRAP